MSEDFIPTRVSKLRNLDQPLDFQTVTFESHKRKKEKQKIHLEEQLNKSQTPEFNIKKMKHEVIKFGMSGFDPQKKEEAKMQLAIKLGAKPPKSKYTNYKLLKQEKERQHANEQSKLSFQQLGKNNVGKSTAKGKGFDRKRRKTKGGLLDEYGTVKAKK